MAALQIANPRQRALVRAADLALAPLRWRAPPRAGAIRRVLLMRLERIGDLLMVIEAVALARRLWPDATLDLAVGSWNRELATMIPGLSTVHVADVPWLSRGEQPASWPALVAAARRWRKPAYDLVVNFEPDIRTNFLAWLTGASTRIGYDTGGGGAFLTAAFAYDPRVHVAANALLLITGAAADAPALPGTSPQPRLRVPEDLRLAAAARLGSAARPWIGLHVNGGRPSKQWHVERFAEVGRLLAARTGGTVVLTGGPDDGALLGRAHAAIGEATPVAIASTAGLRESAGLLASLDVLVTGDTGPMHLAAAVGTPVVALFGPADPIRYGPRATHERVIRVDLPCSPCGLVRLPPVRCRGRVPDCMDGIHTDVVVARTLDLLAEVGAARAPRP